MVFTNACTPAPICMPARQSLAAGQFPRTTGCERYGENLPPGHMTFARRFAQYGYQTVAAGKQNHTGSDQIVAPGHRSPAHGTRAGFPRDRGRVRRAGHHLDHLHRHFVDSGHDRALPETGHPLRPPARRLPTRSSSRGGETTGLWRQCQFQSMRVLSVSE